MERARTAKGRSGKSRANTTPWKAGSGSLNIGKRSACSAHGNRPPSTMAPPVVVPWPPTNLVSECTTTSAPCWIGFSISGVATVLSTMSGTPAAWATAATASRSTTLPAGLPIVSQNTAQVSSSISGADRLGPVVGGEAGLDPERGQHVGEVGEGGAVELGGDHEVGPGPGHGEDRVAHRRHARGHAPARPSRPRGRRCASRGRRWSGC